MKKIIGNRRPITWTLTSTASKEFNSMVGGETVWVTDGSRCFTGTFRLDDVPDAAFVLLDLGDNGGASSCMVYLNGASLGSIVGRRNSVRFCVAAKRLRTGENTVAMVRHAEMHEVTGADGKPTHLVTHDDTLPCSAVEVLPFLPVGAVIGVESGAEGATLACADGSRLRLAFPHAGMVRVTAAATDPAAPLLADAVCLSGETTAEPCTVSQDADGVTISTPSTRVTVAAGDGTLTVTRTDGSLVRAGLRVLRAGACTLLCWPLDSNEHIFGLGENTIFEDGDKVAEGLDKRGQAEDIWVIHSYWHCDKPIPFLLSTGGYGLYLHASYRAVVDLGRQVADQAWCFVDHDRADAVLFTAPEFPAQVRAYTRLTGRSPLPPRWAFGYWQSTTTRTTQESLLELLESFNRKGIPLDVLAIDGWWMEPKEFWQWRPDFYPNPEALLARLREEDVHLSLWSCPFVPPDSRMYREGAEQGYLMTDDSGQPGRINCWVGQGMSLPDVAAPAARAWLGAQLAPFIAAGTSVIKTDGGDGPETPPDLWSATGHSMREIHNLFPVLYAGAVHDAIQAEAGERRVLTWTRTGFTGIQRYPCCWGGDQAANFGGGRVLIRAGQQAGLMGIPYWSHDLGGFGGQPAEEYYIRSMQWGLLSPLSRGHGPVVAPWCMSKRAEEIVARYIRLRYRLLPSLYSYAWHSHTTGEPMMRALVLDYQDDPRVYTAQFTYTLGPDLLVAPIYEESGDPNALARRDVYLPAGAWYDYWTDAVVGGGQTLALAVPLDTLPLYVRAGGLLLEGPAVARAGTAPDTFTLQVYAGGDGTLTYYEDDGQTHAYRAGACATTPLRVTDDGATLRLTIGATEGAYAGQPDAYRFTVRVHGIAEGDCRVNGKAVPLDGLTVTKTRAEQIEVRVSRY